MASAGEKALHAALKQRVFDPVYVLHGEEDFLKDARVRDLVDAAVDPATRDFNLELRRGAELDAETLDALLGTPPMMADRRVVVIRDADKLKKDARATLNRYLTRPSSDTVLVLVLPAGAKADTPLLATGTVVEFAPLAGDRLPKWIAHHAGLAGRTITAEASALLVEAVGNDLPQLAVELDKLASFSDAVIGEQAVSDVVGIRRGESLGSLLDAIAARDARTALPLVPLVLQLPKTTAVSIVMALTVQTIALAYGEALRSAGTPPRALYAEFMQLLRDTGAFPYRPWGEAVGAWAKHAECWARADLDAALAALLAADAGLKDTRVSSDEQYLTSLVLTLCGAAGTRRAA